MSTIASRRLGQTMTITMALDGSCVMEATLQPGARVPPHRHLDQEERFEVREGPASMRLGWRRVDLEAGEILEVPAGVLFQEFAGRVTPGSRPWGVGR